MAGLNRDIGKMGLLYASIGGIIGSGWLFGPLNAAQSAGSLSFLSWIIGACAMMCIAFVYAELTTMFPKSGALIHMSHIGHGNLLGRIWSWILFLAYVSIPPVEVMAVLTYASNYIHGLIDPHTHLLTHTGFFVAIAVLAVLVVLNFCAIRWVLRVNSAITIWKIIIPIVTVLVLISYSFHPHNLHNAAQGFAIQDVFPTVATAGIAFSFFGFRNAIDLAGETAKPSRNIPFAVIGSIVICLLIYLGLQLAFIAAIPPSEIHGSWATLHFTGNAGPLAAVATIIGAIWLSVVLYADALVSPLGTGFIYTTTTSRVIMASGEIGSAPKAVSALNKVGVPWVALIVTFLFGILFFFPFPSWQKMVGYVSSITVLSYGIGPIVLLQLRKYVPDRKRPFRLACAWIVAPVAFIISNAIIIWSGYAAVNFMFVLLLIIFFAYTCWSYMIKNIPTLQFGWAYTWWVIPYFAGMWAISHYGPANMGGNGALSFWSAMILVSILSLFIMSLAMKSGLTREDALENIEFINSLQAAESGGLKEP